MIWMKARNRMHNKIKMEVIGPFPRENHKLTCLMVGGWLNLAPSTLLTLLELDWFMIYAFKYSHTDSCVIQVTFYRFDISSYVWQSVCQWHMWLYFSCGVHLCRSRNDFPQARRKPLKKKKKIPADHTSSAVRVCSSWKLLSPVEKSWVEPK